MKKILSFIDWYLPGYKAGGTIRAFSNMLSFLNDEFEFYIVTRSSDYTETIPYPGIEENKWITTDENIHVFYASRDFISYKNWKGIMQEISYDKLYIHGIFSFWFSILPLVINKRNENREVLVAAHGMFGDHAFRVKSLKKNLFLQLIKSTGLYSGVVFHAANQDEAADIRKRVRRSALIKIANQLPMKKEIVPKEWPCKEKGKLKLAYLGRISPEKNLKFGLEILNVITTGEIILDIWGPVYDESYWHDCEAMIAKLPEGIKVVYKGSLQADKVIDTLQQYHALFLPSRGENFGHAILESMMAGRPVIISDQTPWRNLEDHGAGFDCSLEDRSTLNIAIQTLLNTGQEEFNALSKTTVQYINSYIQNPSGLLDNIKLFKTT